jgi:hypothetical protein
MADVNNKNINDKRQQIAILHVCPLFRSGQLAETDFNESLPKLETLQLLGNTKLKEPEGK